MRRQDIHLRLPLNKGGDHVLSSPLRIPRELTRRYAIRWRNLKWPQVEEFGWPPGAKTLNGKGMNIFCMLGNTFGNYPPEKRKVFLTTLYNEMEVGELFLLGISLRPEGEPCSEAIRSLEKEYLPGEAFMRLGADHPQS